MTQWYLAGELSRLVGRVQLVATTQAAQRDAASLRREAESVSIGALVGVITRALELVDRLCWYSLTHGDATNFCSQATVGAELCEFGMCAGLIEEEVYE